MKKLLAIAFALIVSLTTYAQQTKDVVYLKNGSIIKGVLIEQNIPVDLKLKTADGNTFVFKYEEIEKITKEETAVSQISTGANQSANTFMLNKSFKMTTYNGKEIREMKYKEIRSVLLSANDPEINNHIKTLNTKRTVSTVFSVAGNITLAVGLFQMLTADELAAADGAGAGALVAGAGLMLVGAIVGSGSKTIIRKSMYRYNEVVKPQISFYPNSFPVNGKTNLGCSIAMRF